MFGAELALECQALVPLARDDEHRSAFCCRSRAVAAAMPVAPVTTITRPSTRLMSGENSQETPRLRLGDESEVGGTP